jgi:ornithine cyclodeaminase/alanine dehydrogenase-like protein (mu-crystallin family)
VENLPRRRNRAAGRGGGTLMGGTVQGSQAYGVRHSSISVLYNTETGQLEALFQPGALAWIRTGAASGLATRYMAAPDASVVGIIGSGRQAITQLEGVCAVRPIKLIKVYSRTPANREQFARQMRTQLEIEVVPVATTEECLADSQIVITITNSREPVFSGDLLRPGMHINAAGANADVRHEVDETTIRHSDLIVVDNKEQAQMECGELITAAKNGAFDWDQAIELHEVVGGKVNGRPSPEAITLFESQGIGIEDVAGYAYVLRKAKEQGLGKELPF